VRLLLVSTVLSRLIICEDEEVKAVQIMSSAIRENPQSYTLLHAQCDFLRSKGKLEWAAELAQQAVNCAPSEFVTWAKLTEVYIELGQYESALLTLNSCPMFTYNERDLHRMPPPARTHLPIKQFISDSQILEGEGQDEDTDPALLRLPAPGLRGTFAKAYALLCKLVQEIGWDELLKTRSTVFVMEEEYRQHKSKASVDESKVNGPSDGVKPTTIAVNEDDDASSTRAIRSPKSGDSEGAEGEDNAEDNAIPTIRISSETDHNVESGASSSGQTNGVAKPEQAQHAGPDEREKDDEELSFSNKRLCERWLDNMFMCLYEVSLALHTTVPVSFPIQDLRIWTIFRAEVAHFKNRHQQYRKTGTEWEILGDLGTRLLHKEEAKEAYQRCLEARFSPKAWLRLLEIYADEGDLQKTLNAAIRLTAYQHRWYMEMAVGPSSTLFVVNAVFHADARSLVSNSCSPSSL
jgi:tetratricopeptide (TPR) repeat protein